MTDLQSSEHICRLAADRFSHALAGLVDAYRTLDQDQRLMWTKDQRLCANVVETMRKTIEGDRP